MGGEFGVVSYLALVGMIVTSLVVFVVKKPEDASLTILMASILFLPQRVGIKFPYMPPLNRDSLPYLCLLIALMVRRPKWVRSNRLGRGLDLLVFVCMVGAVITALTNGDPMSFGKYGPGTTLPGLNFKDGLSGAADDLVFAGIPFVLGRLVIRDARLATRFLTTFAVGGLVYTLFILVELRLSPQLHQWIYGYRPRNGDFAQLMRSGGFRPTVFMPHPLALVMFMLQSILAAFILLRSKKRIFGWSWRPFGIFLFVILAACKGTASLFYALVAVPLVSFARPRTQLRVSVAITLIVLTYPALRGADLFPTQTLLSAAKSINEDREGSLAFRFTNEDQLLAKARQREWFGWGEYDRNAIFDPNFGDKLSVTDGEWIINLGIRGAVGALSRFLILLAPIWMAFRALRKVPGRPEQLVLAGTATMLAFSTLDMLPNAMFMSYPFFMAGALVGMTRIFTAPPPEAALPVETDWASPEGADLPEMEMA